MRDGSPLTLQHIVASLPYPQRCDAVFRIVPDSTAYLGYCELPSKSAFLLLVHPSHGGGYSTDPEHHHWFVKGPDQLDRPDKSGSPICLDLGEVEV